jgi:hypothetical protein
MQTFNVWGWLLRALVFGAILWALIVFAPHAMADDLGDIDTGSFVMSFKAAMLLGIAIGSGQIIAVKVSNAIQKLIEDLCAGLRQK